MPRTILLTLLLLTAPLTALAGPYDVPPTIPDTGQTKCYATDGKEIDCAGTGQDGEYSINPMSYTKLDGEGNELPDSAESWVMVRDNVTELIWEVKTKNDDVKNYDDPHDADNLYTWYNPDPTSNGGNSGTESANDTLDFINSLNSAKYGGYDDWRLPSREELWSIINYGTPQTQALVIDPTFFPCPIIGGYWSSTTSAVYEENAWQFFFDYGSSDLRNKSNSQFVRAVRGAQDSPNGSWIVHGDGTATDKFTGLMWQTGEIDWMTWENALKYCENLTLAGHKDWRLPTIKELASILKMDTYEPTINREIFPGTVSSYYWSSTTTSYSKDKAQLFGFQYGYNYSHWSKINGGYVRAVRGGDGGAVNNAVILETVRFTPFHPTTDTTSSPIMKGGKAVRYYRILSHTDDAPLANHVLCYRFSKDGAPIADFTARVDVDDQGFVGIHTPPVLSSGRYDLIVTDHNFAPLEADIFDAPSFQVSISPRAFSESYTCLLGAGVELGKGPGAKVGPVEYRTIEAGLHGQKNISTRFMLETNGDRTDMEVANTVDATMDLEGFTGISGSIFKEHVDRRGRPKLEAGAGAKVEIGNAMSCRHQFENYTDDSRPDADKQLLALTCLFFENLIRTNPRLSNNIVVQKLLEMFIEKVSGSKNYFEGLGFAAGAQIQGSLGAELSFKNPIGLFKGSSPEVSLKAFDAEYVYERTEEEDKDGYDKSRQSVTTDLEIGSFKVGLGQKFAGDKRRKDTPRFDVDLLGGSLVNISGEKSLSFSNGPGHDAMIFKTLIKREGDQFFSLKSEMKERYLELIAADDAAIASIANHSDLARQMRYGDNFEISPMAYDGVFKAFLDIDQGTVSWRMTENDLKLISFPIEFTFGLGLNFEFELETVESYETCKGLIIPGKGMFPTELYERDSVIEGSIKGFQTVVDPFKKKIEEFVEKALETVDGFIEAADELLVEMPARAISAGGAAVKAEAGAFADGVKVSISRWFDDDRRSYRILAGRRSTDGTTEAATVGNVFIVSVETPDGALMTEFPNPLELMLGYTETDLSAAGYILADADRLNIYHWHPDDHYYEFVGGTLDADNLQVSTPIDLPGQYVLAIDSGAPRIVDFNISDGTAAPLISFSVQDELGGLNPAAFAVSLDNETVVDVANYADYLDMPAGVFAWRPETPLGEGGHQLAVAVQDTTGNSETYTFDFTVDAMPPIVDHAPIATANAGAPLTIQASATDNNEMAGVALFYRPKIDESPYRSVEMTAEGANQYAAAIPAENLIGAGAQYFIKAVDAAGNETATDPTDIAVADAAGPTLEGDITVKLTADGLKLTWTPAPDADTVGYRIYAGPSPDALELREELGAFSYTTLPASLTGSYIAVAPFDADGNEGQRSTPVQLNPCFPGDVDCSNEIDLADAIDAFKILTGIALNVPPVQIADLDGDGVIGLAEAINALQHAAGLK